MGLLNTDKVKADLGADGIWGVTSHQNIKDNQINYVVTKNGQIILDETKPFSIKAGYISETFELPNGWTIEIGYVSIISLAAEFRSGDTVLHRTDPRPWRREGKLEKLAEKLQGPAETFGPSPEQKAMMERQKKLYPSMIVDFSFGILFFFVAREFGLVIAALTGAAATLGLFALQPFTKHNLLGGFAVFGVVMSLISAGIAWGFQDDLAVKLRGTFMAIIAACFALYDAFILNGGYLGRRMAMYMEGIGTLNPKKASLALAGATLILMGIDTPLAFILTTDQWIWYNSVFDNFIAIPIVIGAMFMAREKKVPA